MSYAPRHRANHDIMDTEIDIQATGAVAEDFLGHVGEIGDLTFFVAANDMQMALGQLIVELEIVQLADDVADQIKLVVGLDALSTFVQELLLNHGGRSTCVNQRIIGRRFLPNQEIGCEILCQ